MMNDDNDDCAAFFHRPEDKNYPGKHFKPNRVLSLTGQNCQCLWICVKIWLQKYNILFMYVCIHNTAC